jgi:hypothetical protein
MRPKVARISVEEGTCMLDWNERFERKQDEACRCLGWPEKNAGRNNSNFGIEGQATRYVPRIEQL